MAYLWNRIDFEVFPDLVKLYVIVVETHELNVFVSHRAIIFAEFFVPKKPVLKLLKTSKNLPIIEEHLRLVRIKIEKCAQTNNKKPHNNQLFCS